MSAKTYYGLCGSCRYCELGDSYTSCYVTHFKCSCFFNFLSSLVTFLSIVLLFFLTEIIDYLIKCNTLNPRDEFPVFGIASVFHKAEDAYQGFLKDIVCQIPILYQHVDIIEDTLTMAIDQCGQSTLIAGLINIKQLIIT